MSNSVSSRDRLMQVGLRFRGVQISHFVFDKRLFILGFLFLVALVVRLYRIDEPSVNFHATRQYRSLLIARGYYLESAQAVPEWKKEVAKINQQRQGVLEPPIMELLVSAAYRLLGGERIWIPRLLSSLFWLIGGGFLYLVARRLADSNAALVSTAFYLFLPFAVVASRSFQPDPLMIMLLLVSMYAVLQYYDQPSHSRLAITAMISALAFLTKPICMFVIIGVFVSLAILREGVRRSVTKPVVLVFVILSIIPTGLFYLYGVFTAGFLRDQAQSSFLPHLVLEPFFLKGWLNNIGVVVGFTVFIGALLGILTFRQGLPMAFVVGAWMGYAVFCLVFSYHVATHDYYHLQLIPIVALSIGSAIALVINHLRDTRREWYWQTGLGAIALLALILSVGVAQSRLLDPDSARKVRIAQEIGEHVGHSTKAIFLSGDYGLPLEYHGELSGLPWPLVSDLEWERLAGVPVLDAEERFHAWFAKDSPEYFIVEDLREYEKQVDLNHFLTENFPVLVQNKDYIIFDLRQG